MTTLQTPVPAALIFSLASELLVLIIDHAEGCFSPPLTYFFIYRRFSTGPTQARKQAARTKTCCFFKTKDPIILPNGHIFVDSPSIRRRNSTWKVRRDFIDFERRIHVEIMTSIRRGFDFQNRRSIDEFSTWIFLCLFDVEST